MATAADLVKFEDLSPQSQEAIRIKQQSAKDRRLAKKGRKLGRCAGIQTEASAANHELLLDAFPTRLSQEEYFRASPAGCYKCEGLECKEESVDIILKAVQNEFVVGKFRDGSTATFAHFNYFSFTAPDESIWDHKLYARLAYEGFFTITSDDQVAGERVPITELQPYYSVLCWRDFERSKHVKRWLKQLRKSNDVNLKYCIRNTTNGEQVLAALEFYQTNRHGCNWLTPKFLRVMKQASDDSTLNFTLHVLELYESNESKEGMNESKLVAGEIGFSVGKVYTSLSGFSSRQQVSGMQDEEGMVSSGANTGSKQLVLLGRWLKSRGYSFWSLGHCYSPEMDYKRQLGHRVLPRKDFLTLLKAHRGSFMVNTLGLEVNSAVEIVGVASKPELNQTMGRVKALPSKTERYLIELKDKSLVSLKPSNLRRCDSAEVSFTEEPFMPLGDGEAIEHTELV